MGTVITSYRFEYDDPYRVLAYSLIGNYRPADVLRMLSDDEYLLSLVQKEARLLDIRGWFLDCIVESVLADKRRMEMMHQLDKLGKYFYENLDKDRLRKEIRLALSEAGIILVDEG